ncbi:MAG TPA: tetratricopeptide repeat protein [Chloroflexia bacterium]|nr:tetratricopeptide repeat protein [Chloroflexia bacterium]
MPAVPERPSGALGPYIRRTRHAHGLSQEALAQPEFTKSYVSAVERGLVRPSALALALLAKRLDRPVADLAALPVAVPPVPHLGALDEDLAYQLDYVKMLFHKNEIEAAGRLLETAAQEYAPFVSRMCVATHYRYHRLRALVQIRSNEPGSAVQELDYALPLAEQLGDPQEIARTRNALGCAYYAMDFPRRALDEHSQCLHAIYAGLVKDLTLRLNIYSNLANDYWALKDFAQAIRFYQEALPLADDVNSPERQGGIAWGLASSYRGMGNLDRAKLYAAQAVAFYEDGGGSSYEVAYMRYNLAAILIARDECAEAERLLDAAHAVLLTADQPLLLSTLYEHYADLADRRGHLADALEYARKSVALSSSVFAAAAEQLAKGQMARANTTRTYSRSLHLLGKLEERAGNPEAADACFARAFAALSATQYAETVDEIHIAYADLLTARGMHQRAAMHYRAATQNRMLVR